MGILCNDKEKVRKISIKSNQEEEHKIEDFQKQKSSKPVKMKEEKKKDNGNNGNYGNNEEFNQFKNSNYQNGLNQIENNGKSYDYNDKKNFNTNSKVENNFPSKISSNAFKCETINCINIEQIKEKEQKNNNNNYEYPYPDFNDTTPFVNKNNKENNKTMYDAIYYCESIKKLYDKGWDYILYDEFVKRLQKDEKDKSFCPLCIIGETNKGKTYILNLLTNNKLESGVEYKTKGISCKFTNFNEGNEIEESIEKKFLLFDTAGRSEPILIEPEKKKDLKDEDLKKKVESSNRDLKLSEEFMKNVLIKNSKIILVVVNQLSLAEQLFLFELKNEGNFEELYILHNLFNFKNKEEMEDYIEKTIINSIYFDLNKDYIFDDDESKNTVDRPYYFTEEIEKNGSQQSVITHLILGDIETKDDWIKQFNDETIDFLKSKMQVSTARDFFDIGNILQEELINENIIDEQSKIENKKKDNITSEGMIEGTLTLDSKVHINDSENFSENMEFNIMGYTPDYLFYMNEKKTEFVIEVECAGEEDENIKITARQRKGKVFFHIQGKKIYPKDLKELKLTKKYEDKPFSIYFSVNTEKESILIDTSAKTNSEKPEYKNGIYRKVFPISKAEKHIMKPVGVI